jgi:hypothetical protein
MHRVGRAELGDNWGPFAEGLRSKGVDVGGTADDFIDSSMALNRRNMAGNALRTGVLGASAYGGKKLYDQQTQSAPERMWNRYAG